MFGCKRCKTKLSITQTSDNMLVAWCSKCEHSYQIGYMLEGEK